MNRDCLAALALALFLILSAAAPAQEKTMTTSTGMELLWVPPGEGILGSTQDEQAWALANGCSQEYANRERRSKVVIGQGFWMGRTEVTVGQWKQFIAATSYVTDAEKKGESFAPQQLVKGACWKDPKYGFPVKDNYPVNCVSWNDAVAFCNWLTDLEKKANRLPSKMVCRLPSEAEWEYACRAGTHTTFWWGDIKEVGERRLTRGGTAIAPVDSHRARGRNKFGLADMLGNVREWCMDGYDPAGAHAELYVGDVSRRVLRGGSFISPPGVARCAVREYIGPTFSYSTLGFRVCCGVPEGSGQTAPNVGSQRRITR